MADLPLSNLEKQLAVIGEHAVQYIKTQIQQHHKIATANLLNSIQYEVVSRSNNEVYLNIKTAKHFIFVDQGRKAGSKPPPIKPIEAWIKAKGIKFEGMSTTSMAYAISRKWLNKTKHIPPTNIYEGLMNDILIRQQDLLVDGMSDDIMSYVDKIFFDIES